MEIKTKPGASVYSKPLLLTTYDKYVLGFSMSHLWRCPTSAVLVPFFRDNFHSEKHLDIGVGTGFFVADALAERLAKSELDLMPLERDQDRKLVPPKMEIVLMDLNPKSLETAKKRVEGVVDEYLRKGQDESEKGVSGNGKGKRGNGNGKGVDNGNGKDVNDLNTDIHILNKPASSPKKANVQVNVSTIQADVLDESLTLPGSNLFADHQISDDNSPTPHTDPSTTTTSGTSSTSSIKRHSFKSVSMFNLLHCLPSAPDDSQTGYKGQEIKNRAFKLAAECLDDDGVLAGCTILGRKYISNPSPRPGKPGSSSTASKSRPSSSGTAGTSTGSGVSKGAMHSRTTTSPKKPSILSKGMTWSVMKWYNATGVFGNWHDEQETFEKGLREHFEFVETRVVGCMLIFCAKKPKRDVEVDVDVE